MPEGLTGEEEVAWISDRLIGRNPELGSPVWAYREKLVALRAIRALSELPTAAEPPRDTPRDGAEQRVNDEQAKARNRRAFKRSQELGETVLRQQYEKRHGLGYSRADGSWASMRGKPTPEMHGAPPGRRKPSPTTAVADPPPDHRGKIPGELAALIILVIGVCYAIAAPSAQLWGRIAAIAVAVVLGVVLAFWADIPRMRVSRLARVLASIVWVVLGFVESYSIFQSANPNAELSMIGQGTEHHAPVGANVVPTRMYPAIYIAHAQVLYWTAFRTEAGKFLAPSDFAIWLTIPNNSDKSIRITSIVLQMGPSRLIGTLTNPERHIYFGDNITQLARIPATDDLRFLSRNPIPPHAAIKGVLLYSLDITADTALAVSIKVVLSDGTYLTDQGRNDRSRSTMITYPIGKTPSVDLSALTLVRDEAGANAQSYIEPPP